MNKKIRVRLFLSQVRNLAEEFDVNFFCVSDGASAMSNDGTNEEISRLRRLHEKWEKENGFDPDEDWNDKGVNNGWERFRNGKN